MPTLPPAVAKYALPVEPICVVEALPKVCKAVHVLAFAILSAQFDTAAEPLNEVPVIEPLTDKEFETEPAEPVMLAFIEVVESADHTPAFTAARPFHAEEF